MLSGVKVAIFCGGNGSATITDAFIAAGADVKLLVNCFDNGKSTGMLRRLIPGMLGPSDVRKNVARLANMPWLEERGVENWSTHPHSDILENWLQAFRTSTRVTNDNLSTCPLGNAVFAGCYLCHGRDFNLAVTGFSRIAEASADRIINVTNGRNLWLYGFRSNGGIADEGQICTEPGAQIDRICFLNDCLEKEWPVISTGADSALVNADIIVYGPGTQWSSLLPSYAVRGVRVSIADNTKALKVYVANSGPDVDMPHYNVQGGLEALFNCMSMAIVDRDIGQRELLDWILVSGTLKPPMLPYYCSIAQVGIIPNSHGKHDGQSVVAAVVSAYEKKLAGVAK